MGAPVKRQDRTFYAFCLEDRDPDVFGRLLLRDPVERGFEREVKKRLDYWAKLRAERAKDEG